MRQIEKDFPDQSPKKQFLKTLNITGNADNIASSGGLHFTGTSHLAAWLRIGSTWNFKSKFALATT